MTATRFKMENVTKCIELMSVALERGVLPPPRHSIPPNELSRVSAFQRRICIMGRGSEYIGSIVRFADKGRDGTVELIHGRERD